MRRENIDKLKRVIQQPANCENQGGADEKGCSFLIASVSNQGAPTAVEVGDDEATVDSDAQQGGYIVDQEGRDKEEQPLLPTNRPCAANVKVDVGDLW